MKIKYCNKLNNFVEREVSPKYVTKDRKAVIKLEPNNEIVSVVTIGGYYYWNLSFPFLHFKEEEILIATRNNIFLETKIK